jgi:hypothetical protein
MTAMTQPLDIGTRLELLLDDYLIERFGGGAALRLHQPIARDPALVTDAPWEGNAANYLTAMQDPQGYRLYYRALQLVPGGKPTDESQGYIAVAFSDDGKRWRRPELGLYEVQGTRANNIVFHAPSPRRAGGNGFAPFRDANPACDPEARYKAAGVGAVCREGVYVMKSPDGLRWSLLHDQPVITDGAFDSQNLIFWDAQQGQYRAYFRDFRHPVTGKRDYSQGFRCIKTALSPDLVHWSEPRYLQYPGSPNEHLYTNQIAPYPRAPHLMLGFPTRYVELAWGSTVEALPELEHRRLISGPHPRYGGSVTDGLFMSSRDGVTFRRWGEAFIRPGLRAAGNWFYGDNYQNWGFVTTKSDLPDGGDELSFYATEGYWRGESAIIRRYSLRMDGFVSVQAPLSGGEIVTRPIRVTGPRLLMNLSTSAGGSVRIEAQRPDGTPIEGFTLDDSPKMVGDDLAYPALWRTAQGLANLVGSVVRLRFVLRDADLFALQFSQ